MWGGAPEVWQSPDTSSVTHLNANWYPSKTNSLERFKKMRLSFGIKTAPQSTTYEDMKRVWLEADSLPSIDHAWLFDHFMPINGDTGGPCLEGWSLLSAFAALTRRLRIGLMVTGNTYRYPAVLANIGATVDVICGNLLSWMSTARPLGAIRKPSSVQWGLQRSIPRTWERSAIWYAAILRLVQRILS